MSFKHFFLVMPLSIVALSSCRSRVQSPSLSDTSTNTSNTSQSSQVTSTPTNTSNTSQSSQATSTPTPPQNNLDFWVGFGSDYTGEITRVVEEYNNSASTKLRLTTKGSYAKLETTILNSIGDNSYPYIANGNPDHFAEYVHAGIMYPLNKYIEAWNQKNGKNLMEDFYEAYTVENENIYFDKNSDKKVIMGLPFNKSTEVMIVNGRYYDYVRSLDSTIPENVPTTWQELAVVGPKIVNALQYSICNGNYIWGEVDANGRASNFEVTQDNVAPTGKVLIQDVSDVRSTNDFRVLGYDDGGNAFVTLLRQWGSLYTDFSKEIYFQAPAEFGRATFWRTDYNGVNYQEKTLDAMMFVKGLFDSNSFGLPTAFGESNFCARPFKEGKCMFSIGSSGGLSNYVDGSKRIEIHPIPYYDDGVTVRKAVISQGTSLGLFNQFSSPEKAEAERQAAFDAMVALTTGELQSSFVSATGYFPSSQSAFNSPSYQSLLHDVNPTPLQAMYQKAGILNKEVYDRAESNSWVKFVDPGFLKSSAIREQVSRIIQNVCTREGLVDRPTVKSYIDSVWNSLDNEVKTK